MLNTGRTHVFVMKYHNIQKMIPKTRLASGPAMAIVNSTPGFSGSSVRLLTPPRINRVMLETAKPQLSQPANVPVHVLIPK